MSSPWPDLTFLGFEPVPVQELYHGLSSAESVGGTARRTPKPERMPAAPPPDASASTGYRWSAAAAIAYSKGKGYKEDFVWDELEAAIKLHEENKEEDN